MGIYEIMEATLAEDISEKVGLSKSTVLKVLRLRTNKENKVVPKPVTEINMIDKTTGDILMTFPSFVEANRHLGKSYTSPDISNVCKGKNQSAYGHYWSKSTSLNNKGGSAHVQ